MSFSCAAERLRACFRKHGNKIHTGWACTQCQHSAATKLTRKLGDIVTGCAINGLAVLHAVMNRSPQNAAYNQNIQPSALGEVFNEGKQEVKVI